MFKLVFNYSVVFVLGIMPQSFSLFSIQSHFLTPFILDILIITFCVELLFALFYYILLNRNFSNFIWMLVFPTIQIKVLLAISTVLLAELLWVRIFPIFKYIISYCLMAVNFGIQNNYNYLNSGMKTEIWLKCLLGKKMNLSPILNNLNSNTFMNAGLC
jgi:hypothetical protein